MVHESSWMLCLSLLVACGSESHEVGSPDGGEDAPAGGPQLQIGPASAVFPAQRLGLPSETQEFTVTNMGDAPATDLTVSLAGANSSDFAVEANDCSELPPSASCTVEVSFTPRESGSREASLRVGNDSDAATANLQGTGTASSDYNRVFISSQRVAMNLGSVEAYDAECNRFASAVGINSPTNDAFVAWMSSDSSDAGSRLNGARGFVRMDGLAFADELLEGELFRAVEYDETGARLPPGTAVVTGTASDGTVSSRHCDNWTSTSDFGSIGNSDGGPRRWTFSGFGTCSQPWPIYCVETSSQRELIPPRVDGRLLYLSNEDFGGVGTPDDLCAVSKPAGAGSVVALLATDSSPAADLLQGDVTYVRPDGIVVGLGAELTAGLWQTGAWQQGDGEYPSDNLRVWTGSMSIDQDGDETCANWTRVDSDVDGRAGLPQMPHEGSFWGRGTVRPCSTSAMRLYCVETGR